MQLLAEILQLATNTVPKTIKGRPLSDFSVVVGAFRGVYTIYAELRAVGKGDKPVRQDLGSFDNPEDAKSFEKKLIAAGAKPSRTDWRA